MGFLKGLGKGLGQAAGFVIGGATYAVGSALNNNTIKEIGDGVYYASTKAGETLGNAASGIVDIVDGKLSNNDQKLQEGLDDLGTAATDTVKGIASGVTSIVSNAGTVIEGIKEDDFEKVKNGGLNLVKTAAIATLAVGVADAVGLVGDDMPDGHADLHDAAADNGEIHHVQPHTIGEQSVVENPNMHHVDAHWVNGYDRQDGTHVDGYWRDGDGDKSVNTYSGWNQHNPNYHNKA